MRKLILLILFILCSALSHSQAVRLVFYNDVPESMRYAVHYELLQEMPKYFNSKINKITYRVLPNSAYYRPRQRYRAEKLLEDLSDSNYYTIGVAVTDISTTTRGYYDWGIMGLASPNLHSSVISYHRLKDIKRLAKIIMHELGHVYGLNHCPNKGCIMEESDLTVQQIDKEYGFCKTCTNYLKSK
jgi:archaemetzincin